MKAMSQRTAKAIVIMMIVQSVMLHNVSQARPVGISDGASDEVGALSLMDGKVGQSYEFYLRTEGGLPPLTWRVVEGELPPGLALEESGKIKGVPTASRREAYSFAVEVSDSSQPSQQARQTCLLRIAAAPLRVIGGSSKMKIVPQAAFESGEKSAETPAGNQGQDFSWPVVAPKPERAYNASIADGSAGSARAGSTVNDLNPASFIQIYEVPKARGRNLQASARTASGREDFEIYGKLIYDGHTDGLNSTRLTADETSSIVIKPNVRGRDVAFNTIYMSAELSSADTKQNIEVVNYSEVGVAPSADAFVIGASFETAKNILSKMITLQRRATDIVKHVLDKPADGEVPDNELNTLIEIDRQLHSDPSQGRPKVDILRERALEAFDQYAPEIESISSFLITETNRNIVERVANNLFHIDRDTFIAITKQFSGDAALLQSKDADTRNGAIRRLLSRTVQVYRDFKSARAEILYMSQHPPSEPSGSPERDKLISNLAQAHARGLVPEARKIARDIYAYDRSIEAITNLRDTRFPNGWVSLEEARAKDGDTLKVTVRLQNPASAGTGNKVPFYIAVKKYGAKLHWASSFMFIKRTGITEADLMPDPAGNALSEVNFAPSPGVSYGITYFKRGESGGSKFLRALAPTIGINVSFMNFKDPGFDLQSGTFTNTTGTDVQVGTGPIISFFNNKLHFIPAGWNLNVDRKRRYWGIGFGFVEFAKELGKYLKNTGSGSTQ